MSVKPYVVIATPTFTEHPCHEYAGSLATATAMLQQAGIEWRLMFWPGLQFVELARNVLVTKFLQDHPEATDLFFIDDDIGFQPEKVVEFVRRDEPILAGVYPMRSDVTQYHANLKTEDGGQSFLEESGLIRATQVPAGFMRIKRHVIERLANDAPTHSFLEKGGKLQVVFELFTRGPVEGEFHGEDVLFCRKCVAQGIDIFVDPDIYFTHRGTKRWEGSIRDEMNAYLMGESQVAQLRASR